MKSRNCAFRGIFEETISKSSGLLNREEDKVLWRQQQNVHFNTCSHKYSYSLPHLRVALEQMTTQMTGVLKKTSRWQKGFYSYCYSNSFSLPLTLVREKALCKFTSGRYKESRNILLWESQPVLFLPSSV